MATKDTGIVARRGALVLLCSLTAAGAALAQQPVPLATPPPPRSPSSAPASPPASGKPSPAPANPPDDRTLTLDHADSIREVETGPEKGTVIAEGHVRFVYRGYKVSCDRASINRDTHIATLESNIVLDTGAQTVYAEYVSINLRTREFLSRQAHGIIPQSYLGPNISQDLRVSGEQITRDGDITTALNGLLTTCDFPDPHYQVGFARATIIPNKRISLRNAVLYDSKGNVIARISSLTIPLSREIRYTYLPQVGRTEEEGYYVKTALGYVGKKEFPAGILRVDLMQKKGIGLGIDQAYKFGKDILGTFVLYELHDQNRNVNNLNGRLNHQERIGSVLLTATSDFQNNSYTSISPQSQSALSTITAVRTVGPSNTNVTLNLGSSSFGNQSTSNNTAYSVQQTQQFGGTTSVTLHLTGARNESDTSPVLSGTGTSNVRTEQLGDMTAKGRAGIFDISLTANKNFLSRSTVTTTSSDGTSTSQNTNYFSGTERLPDVSLTTDTSRLGDTFLKDIPTRFTIGWGELIDGSPTQRVFTDRALFDMNLTPRPIPLTPGGYLSLNQNGDFRQILYSAQNAAQYILTDQTQLTQKFSSIDSLSFTYGYLEPYGGEPIGFRVDQTGSNNNLGMNYTLNGPGAKLTLLTGYDIQRANERDLPAGFPRNPWQNLSVQFAMRNSDKYQTRFTTTYDWNTGRLLDATNRMHIQSPGGPSLDTSLSFDPATKKFPQVTGTLQTPLFRPDLNLAAYVGYNGVSYRFDYQTFTLTKSYHDYDISLGYVDQPYGFQTQKGFNLSIRLKAFPTFSTQPGGQFGTAITTNNSPVF